MDALVDKDDFTIRYWPAYVWHGRFWQGSRPPYDVGGPVIPGENVVFMAERRGVRLATYRGSAEPEEIWAVLERMDPSMHFLGAAAVLGLGVLVHPAFVVPAGLAAALHFRARSQWPRMQRQRLYAVDRTARGGYEGYARTVLDFDNAESEFIAVQMERMALKQLDAFDANEVVTAALGHRRNLHEDRIRESIEYVSRRPELRAVADELKGNVVHHRRAFHLRLSRCVAGSPDVLPDD